jgi:ribosomal subunit interface protein
MKTIIESTNFEPSAALNKFVKEKAEVFKRLDKEALYAEFNLSATKNVFTCTIILNLAGKDIVSVKSADDMHYAILRAIDAAKRGMRKKKMKKITLKKSIVRKVNQPN